MTPAERLWCGLLLVVFVAAGTVRYWNTRGDDLGASYLGCRVLLSGHGEQLYRYDPDDFSRIGKTAEFNHHGPAWAWEAQAEAGGYTTFMHPYVQTPLWAWSLEPLCGRVAWPWFNRLFVVWTLGSLAGIVWLVAWAWAPVFLRPWAMAAVLAGLWVAQPFEYAMYLSQTHAIYLLLVVAGLVLAERGWEWTGGLLVALAAAVKLTPAALVVYWLVTRRWRAAASVVVWSAVLMAATWAVLGTGLVREYMATLHRVSGMLLLAENNQSFAAWVMGRFYLPDEIFDFTPYGLPGWLKLLSEGLIVAGTAAGGWMDRRVWASAEQRPRLGVGMALVSATVFAPLAWTHYFIVLAVPVMLLVEECRRMRGAMRVVLAVMTAGVVALNYRPFAADVWKFEVGDWAVVRGQFVAGVLCMAGLGVAWWWKGRRRGLVVVSEREEVEVERRLAA